MRFAEMRISTRGNWKKMYGTRFLSISGGEILNKPPFHWELGVCLVVFHLLSPFLKREKKDEKLERKTRIVDKP